MMALRSFSVHMNAGKTDDPMRPTLLSCDACHGKLAHTLLPVHDANSPVFLANQVKTCGGCHHNPDYEKSFWESVHGVGLSKLGLNVGPVCAIATGHTAFIARPTRGRH